MFAKKLKSRERPQDTHETGGKRGDRRRFGDQEPGPGVKKGSQRPVAIANIDVLASSLWFHGAEFGISDCAKERKQTAHQPGQINKLGGAGSLHHFSRHQKNSAADDGAYHDRRCVAGA